MRTLEADEARARVLAAHGLIEGFSTPMQAVEACVAVQTQYAASLSVAVAARTKRSKEGWDRKALSAGGALVKSWSLRHTLHAHSRADHGLILACVGPKFYNRYMGWKYLPRSLDIHAVHGDVLAAIAAGPLTRAQLHERVPELKKIDYAGWGMDVMGLAFQGKLCVIGSGAEQKFCAVEAQNAHEKAFEELLRRYLRSYGPATMKDFSYWTGLLIREIQPAFQAMADELEQVEVVGLPGVRYALRDAASAAKLPNLRLLAKFDPIVMAHADKRLFLSEDHRTAVFRKAGQVEATILIRGQVAGTWRMSSKKTTLSVEAEPFRALAKPDRARLDREAERLAMALGFAGADVKLQ